MPMPSKRKRLRVVERKLGREKAYGQIWLEDNLIEIDPRQPARDYMGTVVHEAAHAALPGLSETDVAKLTSTVTSLLWSAGFRRIRP
jgi:hypothetical protein